MIEKTSMRPTEAPLSNHLLKWYKRELQHQRRMGRIILTPTLLYVEIDVLNPFRKCPADYVSLSENQRGKPPRPSDSSLTCGRGFGFLHSPFHRNVPKLSARSGERNSQTATLVKFDTRVAQLKM